MKQIETTFGVDASAPVGGAVVMAAAGAAAPAEEAEVQTEFKLVIVDCAADKRIGAIKVVRSLTTLGLKEAKDAVTTLPFTILENKPKAEVRRGGNMQGSHPRGHRAPAIQMRCYHMPDLFWRISGCCWRA